MENLLEGYNPREHDDQEVVSDSDVEPTDDIQVSRRLYHQFSRNRTSKEINGSIVTKISGSVSFDTVPSDEDTFTKRPFGGIKIDAPAQMNDGATKRSNACELEGECPLMHALGDVLVNVLRRVSFADRLRVACVSRQLKDFVYEHHELWDNINVVAEKEQPMRRYSSSTDLCGSAQKKRALTTKQGYMGALAWAASRREVRRLRVVVKDDDADMRMMTSRKSQKNLLQLLEDPRSDTTDVQEDSPMRLLVSTTAKLPNLISLSVNAPAYSNDCEFELLSKMIPTLGSSLKQLVLSSGDGLCVPNSLASLGGLQSLSLQSCAGGGVRIEDSALPASLKHLKIGGFAEHGLPQALTCVARLESLDINWAVDQDEEGAPAPDLSLLKASEHWCSDLKSLRLGYFEATRLPEWLPTSLIELELQWNLRTCVLENTRKEDVDVDDFLQSFDVMIPLKNLKRLNLNNAVGQWGLPPAVRKLHQLESLGVVTGSGDEGAHGGVHSSNTAQREHPTIPRGALARQVAASFPNLKSLDIEIFEAASEAKSLAQLKHLKHLRLGKGESPETYVRPDVRVVVGRGLIRLLPSLPELEQVQTEGMLLPATPACGRWNRLLGFEAEELRSQASAAVETLYRRGVALSRWYAWPFGIGNFESSGSGIRPWDEVV